MSLLSSVIRKFFTVATTISPKESIVSLLLSDFSSLRILLLLVLSFQLINGFPQDALAEKVATEKWNISADKVIRYENPNSIVAQGNVVLEKNEHVVPKPPKASDITSWAELLEEQVKPPEVRATQVEKTNIPEYRISVTIKSDWMVYDVELESIKAKGNVQIITNEEQLFAKEVTLNLTKETGKFTDATILRKELSLHLEGKSIEKTGFDTYRIDDGWVITCKLEEGQSPPWSFSSANTEIRKGGYAVLTHARFNIKDVPIFYSPYMILPAKDTRQSGLLFPYFSASKISGIGVNVPLFLNLSDSTDLTFFPEYYSNRGFMPGAELRYVLSATDKGMFTASFLDDPLSDPSETSYYNDTNYTHDNSDRYWIRGKANHNFGDGWQSRLDLDIVSDQDYLSEFNSGPTGFRKTYENYVQAFGRGFQHQTDYNRQNSLKTLRSLKGISFEANLLAINEANTNASESDTPLWKLPGVLFSGTLPVGDTKNYFLWNTSYVNYWRKDGTGGHRIDLKPGISAPIPLTPYLETLAGVDLRNTFYYVEAYGDAEWGNDNAQNRFFPEFKAEVATTLERDFFTGEGKLDGFTHQIRPFIKYSYIPAVDQESLPKWDDVDQIFKQNFITYGADNFFNPLSPAFIKKGAISDATTLNKGTALDSATLKKGSVWESANLNREMALDTATLNKKSVWDSATFKAEQAWNLDLDSPEDPLSAVFMKFVAAATPSATINYRSSYDVYDSNFSSHSFGGEYRNSRGDKIGIDYSYKGKGYREIYDFVSPGLFEEIQQINANFRSPLPFISSWIAGGRIEHSLSQDETINANGSLTYMANCWSVTFETQYTPFDTSFVVLFSLANIGGPFGVSLLN